MIKERNRTRLFLYGSVFVAIELGVYAQDITYFLYENLSIPLIVGLSITTILSLLLFLSQPILVFRFNKQNKVPKKEFNIYFGINTLIGIIISTFSLIVLIVWCG